MVGQAILADPASDGPNGDGTAGRHIREAQQVILAGAAAARFFKLMRFDIHRNGPPPIAARVAFVSHSGGESIKLIAERIPFLFWKKMGSV